MTQGKIIEYIDHGKFVCTICLQDKGNSLRLLTPSNREVKLPPKRAILISQKNINTEKPREELVETLRQTEQLRIRLMEGINIKELWELVRDENEHFDNKYLAHLVFGQDITDDHLSAVVRALFGDHLHFKMKDGRFLANSEEKVEQILKQREEEALREERLNYGSAWLKDIQDGKSPDDPPHKEYIVDLLVQLALYGTDTPDAKYGKELLSKAGISGIQKARDLLIRLGIWEEDENLDLLRFGIETSFTEKQFSESARLAGIEPCFDGREDLRDLFVITIDGPLTQDFDDAVSLEMVDDELHLGIHIADVAGIISPDSIIDKEAAKRATTLYLARRQIPMIPHDLSHDTLSLIQGCDRPAISLFARFDKSGKLLDYRFAASVIKVHRKLTYEEVDEILGAENRPSDLNLQPMEKLAEMLPEMYQMSRRLQLDRMNQDALSLSLPELQVVFHENSSFSLTQDDQDTPSRMIIAELMILYNCLAGRFCRDNQIPALFRTQAEPSERLSEDEAGYIFYVFRQRRKLSPAHIETSAGPHSGLGLDAYIQASSPIRRYFDLVVQRQIRSFLMGEAPVYNQKELAEIRVFVEPVIKDFMNLKRNRIRYWTLKYLSRHRGEKYKAIVIDELRRKYRIVLCDFFLIAEIARRDGVIMRPGEEFVVEVGKADPWDDVLKLEYGE
jgi:exoribonuclease-2